MAGLATYLPTKCDTYIFFITDCYPDVSAVTLYPEGVRQDTKLGKDPGEWHEEGGATTPSVEPPLLGEIKGKQ